MENKQTNKKPIRKYYTKAQKVHDSNQYFIIIFSNQATTWWAFCSTREVVNWTRKIFGWINIKPIFKETVFTIRSNKMWHLLFFYEHTNSDKIPALIINSTPDTGQQGYH